MLTITADNRTEFHSCARVEAVIGELLYFATPHHSWERGTNENTNGLILRHLPKETSPAHVTQADCDVIADSLDRRPCKTFGFKTSEECYVCRRERKRLKCCTSDLNSRSATAR